MDLDSLPNEKILELSRQVRLKRAIDDARDGNPWPFIAYQWPDLIVHGPERELFPKFDVLGKEVALRIDEFQAHVIEAFFDGHKEVAIKGCTKPGKGFAAALALNVFFDIWDECRVIITAPTASKGRTGIFGEFLNVRRSMRQPGPGKPTQTDFKHTERHYIEVLNPAQPDSFAGHHGPNTVFIFDEAAAIADELFKEARKQAKVIVAISNPRVLTGWFRALFDAPDPDKTQSIITPHGRRKLITADGSQVMNVKHRRLLQNIAPEDMEVAGKQYKRGDMIPHSVWKVHCAPLIPNQMDLQFYLGILSDGPHQARVFGRGKFPTEDEEMQIIPWSWIDHHLEKVESPEITAASIDVGMSKAGDKTVLFLGGVNGVAKTAEVKRSKAEDIADWVVKQGKQSGIDFPNGRVPIVIDYGGGYGGQVGYILQKMGCSVIGLKGNQRADKNTQEYFNMRSQLYGEFGRRLDPDGRFSGEVFNLPNITELHEELTVHERIYNADAIRWQVTPKDSKKTGYSGKTIKKEIGRSPNYADALVLMYYIIARQDERVDVSKRSLVYKLNEEEKEDRPETEDEHIAALCEKLDQRYDEEDSDLTWAYA